MYSLSTSPDCGLRATSPLPIASTITRIQTTKTEDDETLQTQTDLIEGYGAVSNVSRVLDLIAFSGAARYVQVMLRIPEAKPVPRVLA